MARSKLIPLTATLFSLLGGVALATPGDERGSVEAELFNETADNGDPVAVLRASGNYAFLPEGTQLTVLLALPVVEGEEQASVTSMDVLVDADGHFELERRWPGKTAAPLRYIASVDLVVNRQVQAVRVWLVREFGFSFEHVERLGYQELVLGTEEERLEHTLTTLRALRGFVNDTITLAQDYYDVMSSAPARGNTAWQERQEELNQANMDLTDRMVEFFGACIAWQQKGMIERLSTDLSTLARQGRDYVRSNGRGLDRNMGRLLSDLESLRDQIDARLPSDG